VIEFSSYNGMTCWASVFLTYLEFPFSTWYFPNVMRWLDNIWIGGGIWLPTLARQIPCQVSFGGVARPMTILDVTCYCCNVVLPKLNQLSRSILVKLLTIVTIPLDQLTCSWLMGLPIKHN
jgi:hypothetical protein